MAPKESTPSLAGSFRLFRVAGISVYLHWSWLVVAFIELQNPINNYFSPVWNVAEYLTLFAIVLLHEFGHSLACRQVGGQANEIVLWPLGGIAFVNPPPRPGPVLWSIAAGPLVNLALVPVTFGALVIASNTGLDETNPDLNLYIKSLAVMNLFLLVFNILPIYPLDGGQILQALLWFVIGRANSLLVASVIGMVAGIGVIGLAVLAREWWIVVLAVFVAFRSLVGFQQARLLARLAKAPRHQELACPSCQAHPFLGNFWVCEKCPTNFDTFTELGVCPGCGWTMLSTVCFDCQKIHPIAAWFSQVHLPAPAEGDEGDFG